MLRFWPNIANEIVRVPTAERNASPTYSSPLNTRHVHTFVRVLSGKAGVRYVRFSRCGPRARWQLPGVRDELVTQDVSGRTRLV
ncbi:unnamed protein product, partial [Iphiclides podalirius]